MPFISILMDAPDPKAPGYMKIRRSEQDLRKRRQEIFDEAKQEGFQAGYDDGYRAGHNKGRREGFDAANAEALAMRQVELDAFSAGLGRAIDSVEEGLKRWLQLSEAALEEMAIEVAEAILHAELSLDRSAITQIVRAAMAQVTHSSEARIRLNPIDSEIMRMFQTEILANAPSIRNLEIVVDKAIDAGCVIETDGGAVDARVGSQVEMVRGALKKAA
jgi:flagellar assembly protein FliH